MIVAATAYEPIARTVAHLRAQHVRERIELVIVSPAKETLELRRVEHARRAPADIKAREGTPRKCLPVKIEGIGQAGYIAVHIGAGGEGERGAVGTLLGTKGDVDIKVKVSVGVLRQEREPFFAGLAWGGFPFGGKASEQAFSFTGPSQSGGDSV